MFLLQLGKIENMDGAAIRQELESYIHENFIYHNEIKQAEVMKYFRKLQPDIHEDDVVYIIKDMSDNGVFIAVRDPHEGYIIRMPSK